MTRPPRRWRWLAAVTVLLVAVGALVALDRAVSSSPQGVSWAAAARGDLVLSAELTGTLQAIDTSVLGPPQVPETWQFKIASLAPEGADVKTGMPVLAFDTSELEQRLDRYRAEADTARTQIDKVQNELVITSQADELKYAEAEARRRKAALKVERPDELVAAGELAKARLDLALAERELAYLERRRAAAKRSADANLAGLRNQLQRAEQQVHKTEDSIAAMRRTSPRAGTVIHVADWRGEKKKVGDTCWRNDGVIEIPDLERMKALGQVHEADSGRVAEGQAVRLRLDAHPDESFSGAVRSIWRTVQAESWNNPQKVVRLEIELDRTDTRRMRPGMRFRGEVELERVAGLLLVPAGAVRLTPAGAMVERATWSGSEPVPVKVGRRNAEQVEIVEGLAEGDRVAVEAATTTEGA
jgi:HlyD family secretion protein